MVNERMVLLVGGVGGAKLAYGLARHVENLTIVVNTGDDFRHYGLHISPDLDTLMYTLAGRVDPQQGWGVAGDTTAAMTMLRDYGEDPWFRLGDRDLATHLLRTKLLDEGYTLTEVTAHLRTALGVGPVLLPMSNDRVATIVDTVEHGEIAFQDYFVRHRWQPTLCGLRFEGATRATISPQVRDAILQAEIIVIGPSNPWLSIAPILALPGMRDLLSGRAVPRVAVTPIVAGDAIKGPTAKLMRELGHRVSAERVAEYYGDVINGFVYDERDASLVFAGLRTVALDTVMRTEAQRIDLAQQVLEWIGGWKS